jgi:hypothetical protein
MSMTSTGNDIVAVPSHPFHQLAATLGEYYQML